MTATSCMRLMLVCTALSTSGCANTSGGDDEAQAGGGNAGASGGNGGAAADDGDSDNVGGAAGDSGGTSGGDSGGSGGENIGQGGQGGNSSGGQQGTAGAAGSGGDNMGGTIGIGGVGGANEGGSTAIPEGYRPSVVAVGWGGLRIVSFDEGKTWGNRVAEFNRDDEGSLLREVTHGANTYVAVGGTIWTSPDGIKWTERVPEDWGWYGGVAYGNGVFVAGGACGGTVISKDRGITWQKATDLSPQCEDHIRGIVFLAGTFYASDDSYTVHVSQDGLNWTKHPQLAIRAIDYCFGQLKDRKDCVAMHNGVYLRGGGPNIERSTNGTTWYRAHEDTNKVMRYSFGYSPL